MISAENHRAAVKKSRAKARDVWPTLAEARSNIDWKRRRKAEKSAYSWFVTYGVGDGGLLEYPPFDEMKPVLELMLKATEAKTNYHIRIMRGGGKTSLILLLIAMLIATGKKKYIVVSSPTAPQASTMLDDLWTLFEENDTLAQDYPDIATPIRALEGSVQKMRPQTCNGKRTKMEKSEKMCQFATVTDDDGKQSGGAVLVAVGFDGRVRGLRKGSMRPDLVLLDDLQDDDMAVSQGQLIKAEQKIKKTYLGLGKSKDKLSVLMTSTPIAPDDLSERFARDPMWITETYPMLKSMPVNKDLWDKYGELIREAIARATETKRFDFTDATRFYRKNRAKMDEGAVAFAKKNYDERTEISAIQHAMNILYGRGEEAFAAEYQMQPMRNASVYDLGYSQVLAQTNNLPVQVVPKECERVFAAVDVMKNAGLRYVLTAFGGERIASVIEYGRYPANGAPLYGKDATEDEQDSAVSAGIASLLQRFASARFVKAGSRELVAVSSVGVDIGWRTRTVLSTIRRCQKLFSGGVFGMKGVAWDKFSPYSASGTMRDGVISADEWAYLARGKYGEWFAFHSDFWRETSQRAWFKEPLQPGSLSVFGDKPDPHLVFANEASADRLIDKDMTRGGKQMWKWSCVGDNHLGDCITMCFAIAYWKHIYVTHNQRAAKERGEIVQIKASSAMPLDATINDSTNRTKPNKIRRYTPKLRVT